MTWLVEGVYDGDLWVGDIGEEGDLGMGRFNELDGEVMGFEGGL
ncbi:acetolactate decarboxylase [Bacillus sp. WP8]